MDLFSLLGGDLLNRMFPWKSLSKQNNLFCVFRVYQKESNLLGYILRRFFWFVLKYS